MTINLTSWKTTLSGLVTAGAAFVAFSPQTFAHYPVVLELAKFVAIGGLASLGFTAKDANVTGGTRANATSDPLVVAATANPNKVTGP